MDAAEQLGLLISFCASALFLLAASRPAAPRPRGEAPPSPEPQRGAPLIAEPPGWKR